MKRLGVKWALGVIETASTAVASVIIMGLTFLVVIDVVGRKLFAAPLSGTTDIAENTLVAIVFLSIAAVQRNNGHIRIEMLLTGRSARTQEIWNLVALILALLVSLPITWYTSTFAWESWVEGDYTMGILRVPVWPAKLIAAFGLILLCLELALNITAALTDFAAGRSAQSIPPAGNEK
jgi:TRAP-type C4-dicarboxylate transport system permease small subunit